ncbi:hypothetical protein ACJX0J_026752, partial [Zea mays]
LPFIHFNATLILTKYDLGDKTPGASKRKRPNHMEETYVNFLLSSFKYLPTCLAIQIFENETLKDPTYSEDLMLSAAAVVLKRCLLIIEYGSIHLLEGETVGGSLYIVETPIHFIFHLDIAPCPAGTFATHQDNKDYSWGF